MDNNGTTLARLDVRVAHLEEAQRDHAKRLTKVENVVWKLYAAALVGSGTGAAAVLKIFGG